MHWFRAMISDSLGQAIIRGGLLPRLIGPSAAGENISLNWVYVWVKVPQSVIPSFSLHSASLACFSFPDPIW